MTLTKAQLKLRANLVTASEIPTIFGINPWQTPMELFLIKKGRITQEVTAPMLYGHTKEPFICKLYQKRMKESEEKPVRLHKCETLVDGRYGATPDRIVTVGNADKWLLECKATSRASEWRDGVPDRVYLQAQWQMLVADHERCDVAAEWGSGFDVWTIERNDEQIEVIKEVADRFIECLDGDVLPQVFGVENELKALNMWIEKDNGQRLDSQDPWVCEAIGRWLEKDADLKELKAEITKLKTQIRVFTKDFTHVDTPMGTITNKKSKEREVFDAEQAFEDLTMLVSQSALFPVSEVEKIKEKNTSTKEGHFRFSVKGIKKEKKNETAG